MLPLHLPSTQANYPASIQQTLSAAASLLAAEVGVYSVLLPGAWHVLLAGGWVGGFITCGFVPPVGFPPLHPHGWRKLHAKIISRSGGMVCSQVLPPDGASPGGLGELWWRAPKVKISCERVVQSIHDVIPVFMWAFMLHLKQHLCLQYFKIFFQLFVITIILGVSGSFSAASCCYIKLLSLLLLHLSGDSTGLSPNPHFRNGSHVNSRAVRLENELLCFMTGFVYMIPRSVSIFIYDHLSFTGQ